jgi:ABC-2 type transport system ATP-binding protein
MATALSVLGPTESRRAGRSMIVAENLSKRFGTKLAVANLNLDIKEGEFFCFLGPNGAGKTTTIKMFTGLLRPTNGRALLGGHDIQKDPVATKQLLGYIPDTPFLYEKLTGREFMRFVAGIYGISDAIVKGLGEELLEMFEIRSVADQLIEDYSHGMRQKLSFASCFLHDPKIVIVDEPWVGLDPKNIRFVKDYLKQKTREGLTVFMSTHTLTIAEEIADRIGIFHKGHLMHLGTVDEIKALASNPGSLEDVFLELTRGETE